MKLRIEATSQEWRELSVSVLAKALRQQSRNLASTLLDEPTRPRGGELDVLEDIDNRISTRYESRVLSLKKNLPSVE